MKGDSSAANGVLIDSFIIRPEGCVAIGQTVEEVENNMREAIEFHLEGMRLHGDHLPSHMPIVRTVQVAS